MKQLEVFTSRAKLYECCGEMISQDNVFDCGDYIGLVVGVQGSLPLIANGNKFELVSGDCFFITPHTKVALPPKEGGNDIAVMLCHRDFIFESDYVELKRLISALLYRPRILTLSRHQVVIGRSAFLRIMKLADNIEEEFNNRLIFGYIYIFALVANEMMEKSLSKNESSAYDYTPDIVDRFQKLLDRNIKTHRDVGFYASKLNVTPKYLLGKVKESTSRTPIEWINDVTMKAIKARILEGESFSNISIDYGFATPSHFSKFFKEHCGVTPSEFKRNPTHLNY